MIGTELPLENNQWQMVAAEYNIYASKNGRSQCGADALEIKFDKLADTKKPTGDPLFPPAVRRTICKAACS